MEADTKTQQSQSVFWKRRLPTSISLLLYLVVGALILSILALYAVKARAQQIEKQKLTQKNAYESIRCIKVSARTGLHPGLSLKVPIDARQLNELPTEYSNLFKQTISLTPEIITLSCFEKKATLLIYPLTNYGVENGYFSIDSLFPLSDDQAAAAYNWKIEMAAQDQLHILMTDLPYSGNNYARVMLILNEKITNYHSVYKSIVKSINITADFGTNVTYVNETTGISFGQAPPALVQESPAFFCLDEKCIGGEGIIQVGEVFIHTYQSEETLDYDYDEGLKSDNYNDPIAVTIGNKGYYLISSKTNDSFYLTPQYTKKGALLWIKTEQAYYSQGKKHYIQFNLNHISATTRVIDAEYINSLFKDFVF